VSDDTRPPCALEAIDVRKQFDRGLVRALDGVTLSVERGEFVAITGPSGSGKSTLLHLFAALDAPTSGTIRVDGEDVNRIKDPNRFRRMHIGLVFQLHNLLPHLDVARNVEIPMYGTHRSRHGRTERAEILLAEVDLEGKGRRLPTELSGGERQRVAIARALANDPNVVLADEPTGSLDSASVERVLGLFRRLRSETGMTLVMVTHDRDVARTADRIVEIRDGRVAADTSSSAA
jgi:putative ABC transport system ATP-binding protein